ncbi:MAG: hypothetical protein RLZZ398_553 [Verrucomicrobiota bacterium]
MRFLLDTGGAVLTSRQLNESEFLPQPDRDRPLGEARNDLAGRLRPSGPDGEIDEWSIYDESFRRLVRWAEDKRCFFEGLQPLKEGGREHDLTFIEESRTWLKFTKPAAAGYVVSFDFGPPTLEPALPLEYLERLQLQNEIFADRVSFVGVAGERHRARIVTRQSMPLHGHHPPMSVIWDPNGARHPSPGKIRQCLLFGTDPDPRDFRRPGFLCWGGGREASGEDCHPTASYSWGGCHPG